MLLCIFSSRRIEARGLHPVQPNNATLCLAHAASGASALRPRLAPSKVNNHEANECQRAAPPEATPRPRKSLPALGLLQDICRARADSGDCRTNLPRRRVGPCVTLPDHLGPASRQSPAKICSSAGFMLRASSLRTEPLLL